MRRWLASAIAEYRRHPFPALVLLTVAVAGLVLAVVTYSVWLEGSTAQVPSPTGVSQPAPSRPAPVQTGDNDRSVNAPSASLRPVTGRPSTRATPARSSRSPAATDTETSPSATPAATPDPSPDPAPTAGGST